MPSYTGGPYNLAKPTVGGDSDRWGDNGWAAPADTAIGLNDNMQMINYHMFSRVDGGTVEGPMTVEGNLTLEGDLALGGDVTGGNLTIDRTGEGVPAFATLKADVGQTRAFRIVDDGGTGRQLLSFRADGEFQIGNSSTGPLNVVTTPDGVMNFYCGDSNLDAALNSSGFYLFGNTGFATTGPVLAEAVINPTDFSTSGGMLMSYAGGDGFIANASGGAIQFRIGGTDNTFVKAYVETNGYVYASAHQQGGGIRIGRGDTNCNIDNVGDVGDINFQFGSVTKAAIKNNGGAAFGNAIGIAYNGTNLAPAIDMNGETGIYNDTAGRLSIADNDVKVGYFDPAATSTGSACVITQEKGDARYLQNTDTVKVLGIARVNSGGAIARSFGTITNVTISSNIYTVTWTSRSNPVVHVQPINYNNGDTLVQAVVYDVDATSCKVRIRTADSANALQCPFNITVS